VALERPSIDDRMGAYLDAALALEPQLADLYERHRDHANANMMTHPDLGRLLAILVRSTGGRAVVEIGTFVGVSATWMAQGLSPGGYIDTLEVDLERADAAEAWFREAGIADRVQVHRGPADESLSRFPDGAYDLAYIDADKPGYPLYLEQAVRVVRSGGLILADNVFWSGAISGPEADDDPPLAALRAYTRSALDHPMLLTTLLTVGDGVAMSVVL
jgi:predicted O-methyltransferase YrrM